MPDNRKLRVFLCHASQDKPIVRELYQRLLAEGWIDPWLDKEKLLPGEEWELEIEKSVEKSDAVIVFLSNSSVMKEGYFQKELKKVVDIAKEKPEGVIFIIPLRLDECDVPPSLRKWQFVDYFPESNKGFAQERIVASLRLRANVLKLIVENVDSRPTAHHLKVEKKIQFSLNTGPRVFIDWFYQNYFYKGLSKDKRGNLPPKASDHFYKPLGPYNEADPIPLRLITERLIDGKIYKGTIALEIETISHLPNLRISVTMKFEEDDFFLVFYRMLVVIARVYQESSPLIMAYLGKYRNEYEAVNPEKLTGNS